MARGVFERLALAVLVAASCGSFGCQGSADAGTFGARSQEKVSPASADADYLVLLQVSEVLRPAADVASWPLASVATAPTGEELRLFKPNHHATSKRARIASGKQALAAAHILASAPRISLFPWQDLVNLAKVQPSTASQEEGGAKDVGGNEEMDADETRRMNEMMGLLQEFVDYVTEDSFMRSFELLSASYQDKSVAFRSKATTLLHSFLNSTRDSSDRVLMRKVSRYMDANVALIHQFLKQMQGKMGIFVESMPTGFLQAKTTEILPRLSSIAALVDSPGGVRRGGAGLRRLGPDASSPALFCNQMEPLLENSSRAVHEFSELMSTVNTSQESIPMIGHFMDAILPDSPEAAEVAPRVMQLEEQVLDTVYSVVLALREVTRGYDCQVGDLLRERFRCNTTSSTFESAGSKLPLGPASLLAPLAALLLWP